MFGGALIGFMLYEALFEVRARYVYIYAPYFILLAGQGLKACRDGLGRLWRRKGPAAAE